LVLHAFCGSIPASDLMGKGAVRKKREKKGEKGKRRGEIGRGPPARQPSFFSSVSPISI